MSLSQSSDRRELMVSQQSDGSTRTNTLATAGTQTANSQQHAGIMLGNTVTEEEYYEEEFGMDFGFNHINVKYCCTCSAFLRIAEIFCCFVIVGCVSSVWGTGPFIGILAGHTFALVLASLCMCITFAFLICFCFGIHMILDEFPWRTIDLIYSIVAAIGFLIACALEVWYATGKWAPCSDRQMMYERCPVYYPWAAAAVFCLICVVLYSISACMANTKITKDKKSRKQFR